MKQDPHEVRVESRVAAGGGGSGSRDEQRASALLKSRGGQTKQMRRTSQIHKGMSEILLELCLQHNTQCALLSLLDYRLFHGDYV